MLLPTTCLSLWQSSGAAFPWVNGHGPALGSEGSLANKHQLGEDLDGSTRSLKAFGSPHPSSGKAGSSEAMRTTPPIVTASALLPPKKRRVTDSYVESPLLLVSKTR